jgi:hypothetical protein
MSRFRILRIDHYDPVSVGKRNRLLYTIYGIIPTLFVLSFNLGHYGTMSYGLRLIISLPVLALIYILLLKKMRSDIDNIKTIGEIEITQSGLKKRLGDSMADYNFQLIKEIRLTKHIPATRIRESKSRYFSYILKITFHNRPEETLVVCDRSVDNNQKISITDTLKTLKKIVHFDVIIDI